MSTESEKDRRAQKAMLRRNRRNSGFCYHADPKRQVIHCAVHKRGYGTSFTLSSEQLREMIIKLLRTEIDAIADLRTAVNTAAGNLIEWHYVADEMPDEDTMILIAGEESGQPSEGYLIDGRWCYANSGLEIPCPYAWAHLPEIPAVKKGGAS